MKSRKIVLSVAVTVGLLVTLALAVSPAQGAPVEQANLLLNASFEEGTYMYNNDGDQKYVPNNWVPWWSTVSNADCNQAFGKPHYEIESHPTHVKDGTWSARYWTAYIRHDGGLYQSINATPGTTYRFTIYAFSWSTNDPQVDTASTSQESVRVGIDPTGGTNGGAASVVWSAENWTNDKFLQLTVDATATGNKITVFTRTKSNWCVARNDSFWDAATLVVVGQGPTPVPAGPTPVPTQGSWGLPPGSIVTATPQPDGSIIHTVQSGESCTGLAVAYNVPLDQIYSLNNLTNDKCRFIYPGQKLTIRGPTQPTPAPTPTAAPSEATAEPTSQVAEAQSNGTICVMGYQDTNGNRIREPNEPKLAGMAFEVSNGTQVIGTYTTDALSEPYCFAEVPPGNYIVSWTGEGLTPTTEQSWQVTLAAGTTVSREFGAQTAGEGQGSGGGTISGPPQGGGLPVWAMALIAALGVILVLSGVGIAGYFILMRRTRI